MKDDYSIMMSEEEEIKSALFSYIEVYNSQNLNKKIDLDNMFINNCVNKPGAIGCYYKNNKWYIYRIDDRFNLLVNGPFTKEGVIVALAKMLYIPSNIIKYNFSDEEYDLYLQGEKPVDTFDKKML